MSKHFHNLWMRRFGRAICYVLSPNQRAPYRYLEYHNRPRRLQAALWIVSVATGLLLLLVQMAHAAGPKYVAGASYFDPAVKCQPITWPKGAVVYYTDQGDLSPILSNTTADAFVADAFSRWTSVPTAALTATRVGHLAEGVNGTNVILNPDNTITMPADIQPSATNKPLGMVYDFDGKVTDALLGAGSGDPMYCFSNAVFGGPDRFSTAGQIVHALVVLNGNCVQTSTQLPDVKYGLVRVLGHVGGLTGRK